MNRVLRPALRALSWLASRVLRSGARQATIGQCRISFEDADFLHTVEEALAWLAAHDSSASFRALREIVELSADVAKISQTQGTHIDIGEEALYLCLSEGNLKLPMCNLAITLAGAALTKGSSDDTIVAILEKLVDKMDGLTLAEQFQMKRWSRNPRSVVRLSLAKKDNGE